MTDILTLIHMLRTTLHTPTRHRVHKHKHMLRRIVNAMLSRAGTTSLYKVRAHVGVAGNELADTAARIAAEAQGADDTEDAAVELQGALPGGHTSLTQHADAAASRPGIAASWLRYPVSKPGGDEGAAPDLWNFDELKHQVARWIQPILSAALLTRHTARSAACKRLHDQRTDLAQLPGSSFDTPALAGRDPQAWSAPGPYTLDSSPAPLVGITSTLPWHHVSLAMQLRWGQLFTRARAHRLYPTKHPDPTCGLCQDRPPETIPHCFGACAHPVIHGLRCKRHGALVKCLVDTIAAGGLGDRLLYHDSELGDRTARNLPGFLPRHQGHTTPDIIFLPAMEPNRAHTISLSQLTPEERVLVCVEVTHAADTRLSAAVADKLEQHSSWMHYLVQQGWQVTCFPVAVSHSGLVTSTARAALERCGVEPRQAATAVRRLVRSALACNVQIRTSRRSLYAQTQPTAQNPPDPA